MKIECISGPTRQEVGGNTYIFAADEEGRFVADIPIEKHAKVFLAVVDHYRPLVDAVPPELTGIDPATAVLGDPDFTLHCFGSGFTPESIIVFAGQDEPIVYLSDSDITTGVKPSLGWGADTPIPVSVRNADGSTTDELVFTFTAAAPLAQLADEDEEEVYEEGEWKAEETEDTRPVTEINGIGPAMEAKLASAGITDARQIAELNDEDAASLDEQLGLGGRIAREEWVEQAKALIK